MTGTGAIVWRAPVWAAQASEDTEEVDEPPELKTSPERFRRAPVRRQSEQTSLLTKAIMGLPEPDIPEEQASGFPDLKRRRSMASNISIASTADLTSDTGFTSPARTNTPSPPMPEIRLSRINGVNTSHPKSPGLLDRPIQLRTQSDQIAMRPSQQQSKPNHSDAPPKRCIQFACAANPPKQGPTTRPAAVQQAPPPAQDAPRRPCIKFACSDRPSTKQSTPPRATVAKLPRSERSKSPATPEGPSAAPSAMSPSTPRQSAPRRPLDQKKARPKYLRANSTDLTNDGSQFHEFASEITREADWIRQDSVSVKTKLTINDTLTMENEIRRIGTEAEEEAELEEQDADEASDEDDEDEDEDDEDEDDVDEIEDEGEDVDAEDEDEEYGLSDGYYTDEETGFASSDESDTEADGNMILWTLSKSPAVRPDYSLPLIRRSSLQDHESDSSASTTTAVNRRRSKMQRIKPIDVPDLPDSTDFVCGTLDEDRPLEEAYLSHMAARKKEKLRVIPQDIDPSFPASEPEDEDDEDIYNPVHHDSDDDYQLPGEMEDLHHDQDRSRRRRKSEHSSPRKYHSPPPKRHQSPPPKPRGRSPKNLFDRRSPRRMRSPAPKVITTPMGSLKQGNHVAFNLAARPFATTTKSLPRAPAMFRKQSRHHKSDYEDNLHVRGAVDIVKGLERKRQRRKEKFYQKYCNRARRGQIPERKPQPRGLGAERMKELGLLMAGKKDQGNYVLSI